MNACSARAPHPGGWKHPHRVIYVVSHSYPYCSNGYAVRSHEVARALGGLGHEVIVLNHPGRPWDIDGFAAGTKVKGEQVIDGVRYVFLPNPVSPGANRRARLRLAEQVLCEAFEIFRPGAVLAASNWENAEPAQNAARRWGCAFFYEARGFWEMSRAAEDPDYAQSEEYTREQRAEQRIAEGAQAVFTLNRAMGEELARRGVSVEKIHLVPNGVSPPGAPVKGIERAGIGCKARYLLGYIGSLSAYEGLGDLVELLARLRGDGVDVDLVIVGSSARKGLIGSRQTTPPQDALLAQATGLGMGAHIHFVGQVPPHRIAAYYRMIDAMVMPRRRTPVSELVAPLKPYTAAGYGVAVFLPDMAPLDEVARDIHASLYPEGDIGALAKMVRHRLESGPHPGAQGLLPPGVRWAHRVLPMSRLLRGAAAALPDLSELWGAAPRRAARLGAPRFDTGILPEVALGAGMATGPVAALGPCAHLEPGQRITRLSRVNILSHLATAEVGRLVIDWVGLQDDPKDQGGEWAGLWSIDNMRLNRQVMDACRIGLDRGWQLQVVGPVARARAPLFRTVSGVLQEVRPNATPEPAALREACP